MDKELGGNTNISMFLPTSDTKKELDKYKETCKKAEIVKDAIFNMPEKQSKYQTVLIMREIENLSYNDISERLEINLSTVKSQIKKGREIIVNKVSKKLAYIDEHGLD